MATAIPTAADTKFWTGEPGHLRQVAHRRLAAVVLPVRVRDEARGGVERERGRDAGDVRRVQEQRALDALEEEEPEHRDAAEREERERVDRPRAARARGRCRRRGRPGARPGGGRGRLASGAVVEHAGEVRAEHAREGNDAATRTGAGSSRRRSPQRPADEQEEKTVRPRTMPTSSTMAINASRRPPSELLRREQCVDEVREDGTASSSPIASSRLIARASRRRAADDALAAATRGSRGRRTRG